MARATGAEGHSLRELRSIGKESRKQRPFSGICIPAFELAPSFGLRMPEFSRAASKTAFAALVRLAGRQ